MTAALSDVSLLRHYIDEQDNEVFADQFLVDVLERTDNIYRAASEVWMLKAARWARLVTTAEAGASKNMSDLHKQALAMASDYSQRADAAATDAASGASSAAFVVDITR